ncbi:NADH:ubiquinone oxidoreductase subunit L [Thalassospira sp. HJ]|uniref:NADH-quinone oxidoreductase subunit L n=1 Tax=Thalassospira sp. HJ TaxID=1616823 RepID=UPI0005CEC8A8|nr:NADH-quinone oxidoreductase subunit L [Thalassospira sp. HJ]KJE36979.1 NADH:ubiquinone oxidoreductase subunit L [Thalassospira sp. HJ]
MYPLIVFLPLIAAILAGVITLVGGMSAAKDAPHDSHGHHHHGVSSADRVAQLITVAGVVIAFVISIFAFVDVALGGNPVVIELFTWISSGSFDASWSLRIDTLTCVMLIVVTGVSSMVHIYSIGYMSHDPDKPRFMAYLSLFTFAMLMLITADNLIQLFFGWEGVGLASYLLIGFWYSKPSASAAAMKAFIVNRVGDFGFALGIFAVYVLFDSVQFDVIFGNAEEVAGATLMFLGHEFSALEITCFLLFIGAMGKSAQLGLHTWLPDAMEGPTPVSALIHAATMVTAGVFMVARLSPIFEYAETTLMIVTIVGASTAFFAATIGCVQNDIKRVIAYSTCSQLGYMFFACGVSAYSAGVFHLMTHGFFKALLFLGAGSVIHAMSDEQDMRKMGGIAKMIPLTFAVMVIGTLAITGVPGFAGYYSKDLILESAYAAHTGVGMYAFWAGILAALMTSFYSWRLIFLTFFGAPRADERTMAHVHESPAVMTGPLLFLTVGAIFAGWFASDWFGVGDYEEMLAFWNGALFMAEGHQALEHAHHVPGWVKWAPFVAMITGLSLAIVMYKLVPTLPRTLANTFNGVYRFALNKWYFDELYDKIFVKPAFALGYGFWKSGDGAIIDGCGPDGVAAACRNIARRVSAIQSGFVYHYAFAMLIGIAALVSYTIWKMG